MKHIGILSIFFAAIAAAAAQTATNTPSGRAMTLADCIQAALAHNYDVQIQSLNPQLSLYRLNSAYSGYDPTFSISGTHTSTKSTDGGLKDVNSFGPAAGSTIGGTLPWGLQYGLSGNLSETHSSGSLPSSVASVGVTLTQPLLKGFLIDQTRVNIRVAKNNLQQSEQGLRQQLITSVTAVANAYYDLIYAQQNVAVQQEALNLAQTQLDQDRQRLQIGTLAVLSVQQGQSDCRPKHARHGPKQAQEPAYRQLFPMARHEHPANGTAAGAAANVRFTE